MELNKPYNREDFVKFIKTLINDFSFDPEELILDKQYKYIKSIIKLGKSKNLELQIYEIEHNSENDPRVSISREAFSLMRKYSIPKSLIIFKNKLSQNYRLSLINFTTTWESGKGVHVNFTNPRRYSYYLGINAKINTPKKFLFNKGNISNFEDLKNRFSLEVVNKEFYKEIAEHFTKLVGGTRGDGKNKIKYDPLLKLPSVKDGSQTSIEFAVRLIGRIIFCWFLKEKISPSGTPLMPKDLLSFEAVHKNPDYYHQFLEPIFFWVLNRPIKSRKEIFAVNHFSWVPYLNGGLFSPHDDDFFSYNDDKQAINNNIVVIPNKWISSLFEVLERYNFTIDENTSYDEELSIDPEMLGRIFENLLAEISPETGESARKSTGSYYTPRDIVDYMVDESLLLYLKNKTNIEENKLRAIITYDLTDDLEHPLTNDEKENITNALEKIKILDPACGSGAFPIGALQKIVHILQQVDPHGKLWFEKQIKNTSPEMKRVLIREFENKNFDYIRKTGIIRENIYGVDIQPIATEISRLRCFLTLIVDQQIDDNIENRGIEPLPNLDFKFVSANSLTGLPKITEDAHQEELFEDTKNIDELKFVREAYFNSSGIEREQLKREFEHIQKKMFQHMLEMKLVSSLTHKLSEWEPFSGKSNSWFDPEWMFGIRNGFDIVLGNPPYISINKLDKNHVEILKKEFAPIHTGYNDLLFYFIFKGIEILSEDGIYSMIVANYFLGNTYAKLLRSYLKNKLLSVLNFKAFYVFQQANVHTSILFAKKFPNQQFIRFYNLNSEKELKNIERDMILPIKINRMNLSDTWLVADEKSEVVIKKLFNNSDLLGKIVEIEKGSTSGNNKVFTLSQYDKEKHRIEVNIIRKNVKSGDITKYKITNRRNYILYIDNKTNINLYPNTYKYLSSFKTELEARNEVKKGLYPWYRLERPRNKEIFDSIEKLLVPYRAKHNNFAYDNNKYFNDGGDIRALVLKKDYANRYELKYVLALLNSTLIDWYYGFIGKPKGHMREYFNIPMAKIPIKQLPKKNQKSFIEKVEGILNLTATEDYQFNKKRQEEVEKYEEQLDQMVYELYGLTDDEIKIVEKSTA